MLSNSCRKMNASVAGGGRLKSGLDSRQSQVAEGHEVVGIGRVIPLC